MAIIGVDTPQIWSGASRKFLQIWTVCRAGQRALITKGILQLPCAAYTAPGPECDHQRCFSVEHCVEGGLTAAMPTVGAEIFDNGHQFVDSVSRQNGSAMFARFTSPSSSLQG
eukprot:3615109-Rhodomonas_salina.2